MSSILYSTTGILGRSLDAAASGTNDTTVGPDLAEIVGWVSANNDRGTADVIWSSCVTIFLCVWVATSPNVPGPDDKWYHMWHDKLNLAFIGLAGPDFLLALAVGQLSSARRNVQMFRQLPGGHSWTLKHGFLADMGGFYIRAPDYPNGFPINGEQLVYLIKHGHLDLPALTEQDINHRSKIDGLSKVITIWQAAWFIITQAQRIAKGYPITTLELTALSFSAVMIVISASWYHKPSISQCIFLDTKDGLTIAAIRDDARSKSKTHPDLPENYHRTPLDFISRRPLLIDELWQYHSAMSHRLYVPFFTRPLKSTPWERFPSDTWFEVTGLRLHLLGPAVVVPFSVSFLASWNFHFCDYRREEPLEILRHLSRFLFHFGIYPVYAGLHECLLQEDTVAFPAGPLYRVLGRGR